MKDAGPPRFVPILTEVVKSKSPAPAEPDPAALTPIEPGPAIEAATPAPALAPSPVDEDDIARRVLERVLLDLEPLVLDALRTVQVQQARSLEVLVRAELATRVARLVNDILVARPRD